MHVQSLVHIKFKLENPQAIMILYILEFFSWMISSRSEETLQWPSHSGLPAQWILHRITSHRCPVVMNYQREILR